MQLDEFIKLCNLGDRRLYKDEYIFTPIWVAERCLDTLPKEVWSNPNLKFLNPFSKTGVFEYIIYMRLMEGLKEAYPDVRERRAHILTDQLFSIAIDDRSFDHIAFAVTGFGQWLGDNIVSSGTYANHIRSLVNKGLSEVIAERFGEHMKFDIIVGNPPYQEMTGGGASTKVAMPLYNEFIMDAIRLKPEYISMVIPSRWLSGGKSVLDDFRNTMILGHKLKEVHHFERASDVFDGVDIAGGVMYFLWNKNHNSNLTEMNTYVQDTLEKITSIRNLSQYKYIDRHEKEQIMVIADNRTTSIIDKATAIDKCMNTVSLQYRPFGLGSDFNDSDTYTDQTPIKVVCSNGRITYTSMDEITQNKQVVSKWKLMTGKVNGYADPKQRNSDNKKHPIINKPRILGPSEICSMTYLVLDTFNSQQEAINAEKYIKTQFARFLITPTLSGMNMTSRNFIFVPVQDYTENSDIDWSQSIENIDEQLFNKYGLTDSEREYIKSKIKPME